MGSNEHYRARHCVHLDSLRVIFSFMIIEVNYFDLFIMELYYFIVLQVKYYVLIEFITV